MSRPKASVIKALRQNLPTQKKLLLGVSGGKDSVTLLHGVMQLKRELGLDVEVAHIDHRLRETSAENADFVKRLAGEYGVPFHVYVAEEFPKGVNTEAWGRKIRYEFFRKIMTENDIDLLLTAHTASDSAETFLMRLVSNKELTGIAKFDARRKCLRPLLDVPRSVIDEYVKENALEYREDETNADESYLRNKVRHTLIPFLAENFDNRIEETLAERSWDLQEDIDCLKRSIEHELEAVSKYEILSKTWLRTVKKIMPELDSEVRWRFAEALLLPVVGYPLGRSHAKDAVKLLTGKIIALELPGGVSLRAKNSGLELVISPSLSPFIEKK